MKRYLYVQAIVHSEEDLEDEFVSFRYLFVDAESEQHAYERGHELSYAVLEHDPPAFEILNDLVVDVSSRGDGDEQLNGG